MSGVKGNTFSRRATQVGAILVAAMGVVMFTNAILGAGSAGAFRRTAPAVQAAAAPARPEARPFEPVMEDGVQIVKSTLYARYYPAITVQQGIPVRWTINAPAGSINGCNYAFIIQEYGIQHVFSPGENVIEFVPERAGRFRFSCWMSMIHGTINVVAPEKTVSYVTDREAANNVN